MKLVLAALAVTALSAVPALAQTTAPAQPAPAVAVTPAPVPASIQACGAAPAAPSLPDLSTVKNAKDVNAATEQLNTYLTGAQTNLACRRDAITAERQALLAEQEQLKLQTDSYNADVKAVQQIRDTFQAQVEAFNERQNKRR